MSVLKEHAKYIVLQSKNCLKHNQMLVDILEVLRRFQTSPPWILSSVPFLHLHLPSLYLDK